MKSFVPLEQYFGEEGWLAIVPNLIAWVFLLSSKPYYLDTNYKKIYPIIIVISAVSNKIITIVANSQYV